MKRPLGLGEDIWKRVVEVFGEKAPAWLESRPRVFGGSTPMEMIWAGKEQAVLNVLGRIEHGVYS